MSLNPVTGEISEKGVYVEQKITSVAVPDVNVWKSSDNNAVYTMSIIRPKFKKKSIKKKKVPSDVHQKL